VRPRNRAAANICNLKYALSHLITSCAPTPLPTHCLATFYPVSDMDDLCALASESQDLLKLGFRFSLSHGRANTELQMQPIGTRIRMHFPPETPFHQRHSNRLTRKVTLLSDKQSSSKIKPHFLPTFITNNDSQQSSPIDQILSANSPLPSLA
jgi:hypothetical protein